MCRKLVSKYINQYLSGWDKASVLRGTSHLGEILFIPGLHEKNVPPGMDTLHPSEPVSLFF